MTAIDLKLIPDARRMIENGDFSAAIRLHRRFFPPENIPFMHDTEESDFAECFSTPLPVFSFCTPEELRELRIRYALGFFRGFDSVIDDGFPWPYAMTHKAVLQNFYMSIAGYRNLSSWRKTGVVEAVHLLNSNDGPCPVCRAAAAEYAIANAPAIPILSCQNLNAVGCRCILTAAKIKGINW